MRLYVCPQCGAERPILDSFPPYIDDAKCHRCGEQCIERHTCDMGRHTFNCRNPPPFKLLMEPYPRYYRRVSQKCNDCGMEATTEQVLTPEMFHDLIEDDKWLHVLNMEVQMSPLEHDRVGGIGT